MQVSFIAVENFSSDNLVVSAHPSVVTPAINNSGDLEKKTRVVLIYPEKDQLDVYRESKTLGLLSRDIYCFSTGVHQKKDDIKYNAPPVLPDGAFVHYIGNTQFSTMAVIEPKTLTELADKLNL